jgi:spore photoproduct lyase
MLDAALSGAAKEQLAAEVIFLTHTEELHEVNLLWHPKGERLLWRPDIQEQKTSQASGDRVLRYEKGLKRRLVREFTDLLNVWLPYCEIRYAF